ncbi:hypothetical protein [Cohnella cellulosilytica]|uniref:hypothetical protein n=1 Tax=Cohnella cellulosilytica TaxID=986710 RepID=UPI00366FD2FF
MSHDSAGPVGPVYDDDGVLLTQSGIGEQAWALYHTDPAAFRRAVKDYFALGYPGWTARKVSYKQRIVWIRDDRGRTV